MKYALLIPCYEPDGHLIRLTEDLRNSSGADFYMVNDGSGIHWEPVFRSLKELGANVISYPENRGKGYALRRGIEEISRSGRHYSYIITADADGQHSPEDIQKIASAAEASLMENSGRGDAPLLIGTRDFTGKNVPLRSRFGNRFSSVYFKFVTGVTLPDTQSGLRAIPERLFELALGTPGDRYDYEMNFLIAAADSVRTVPIHTVYESGNKTSHFRPVADSVRIYKTPLRYIAVSALSAAVDLSLFTILTAAFGTLANGLFAATVSARLASGVLNFILNRKWSFASIRSADGSAWRQAARYAILFCSQMFLSFALVALLAFLPFPVTLIKMAGDSALALFSYYAQHSWVFKADSSSAGQKESKESIV